MRAPVTVPGREAATVRRESFQDLKPTIWIGKRGATGVMIDEIRRQLKSRKIVKVRWLRNTEVDPESIAASAGADLLEVRGRTLVLAERRSRSPGRDSRNI
nr:YhbY family RNA-binding protein [Methanoculleus bourgensis]